MPKKRVPKKSLSIVLMVTDSAGEIIGPPLVRRLNVWSGTKLRDVYQQLRGHRALRAFRGKLTFSCNKLDTIRIICPRDRLTGLLEDRLDNAIEEVLSNFRPKEALK